MNEELEEVKQVLKLFGLEQDAEKFYNLCVDNGVDPSKALDAVKELFVRYRTSIGMYGTMAFILLFVILTPVN